MKRIAYSLLIALALAGCATTAGYEQILKSYMGVHVDYLVSRLGPPDNSYTLSDGGQVLEYFRSSIVPISYTVPNTTYHTGTVAGPGGVAAYQGTSTNYVTQTTTLNVSCRTTFTTNSDGRVISWKWQGNGCRAIPPK